MSRLVLFILTLGCALQAWAFDIQGEVKALNQEYGQSRSYPIVIFDKKQIRAQLAAKGLLAGSDEEAVANELKSYVRRFHGVELDHNEAINLVPYVTKLNDAAMALPFFHPREGLEKPRIKACVVMPSGSETDHLGEVKRVLGFDGVNDIYKGVDLRRVMALLSLKELKLFSLYHELSHCLDTYFLPEMYEQEPDGHQIHLAESFAEVNALFLLSQKKDLSRLGAARALLRGLYSRYQGPFLAKQPPGMAGPAYNQGGTIYFLSTPLLQAQNRMDSFSEPRVQGLSLEKTLQLSREIVNHHALKSRSFVALHRFMREGDAALAAYKEMAQEHPDMFLTTYQDLISYRSFLGSITELLPN